MSDEKTPTPGFKVEIGKEIDSALGDVIRGFLKKPAEEAGSLIADSIGLLGDRVRRKREINMRLGIEEVRKKLEASNIDMEDITPPSEEDLHLLMSGMSLSGDETTRDLWAGLFAKALDPTSDLTAERPFISVLQSLSPMDAKIVDFLAFVINTDNELQRTVIKLRPKDMRQPNPEEIEAIQKFRVETESLRRGAVKSIEDRATDLGIKSLVGGDWSENLMRQGVIEKIPTTSPHMEQLRIRSLDERGMHAFATHFSRELENIERVERYNKSPPTRVFRKGLPPFQYEPEVRLTPFGLRLAKACGLL